MKIVFIFSCSGMFRDVPECSGMFHVLGFIDALQIFRRCYRKFSGETTQKLVCDLLSKRIFRKILVNGKQQVKQQVRKQKIPKVVGYSMKTFSYW